MKNVVSGMFMFGASAGGVHVHRLWRLLAERKRSESRARSGQNGLVLDPLRAFGKNTVAMDGDAAYCCAFFFNSVK